MGHLIFWAVFGTGISRPMAGATDWPQWRGPERDGQWNEEGIADAFPPGGQAVVWRVPVGRGWSSAVVSGGRVIVIDVQVEGKVAKERLLCLEETTGRPVWTHEYVVAYPAWALVPAGGGPRATPVICQRKVYAVGALGPRVTTSGPLAGAFWGRLTPAACSRAAWLALGSGSRRLTSAPLLFHKSP